ncbi:MULTISPECIES: GMC oxidoreductase [Bradyrhizobium]|uniref:GMC family oxidoreductase n=2 Tax=Bradyrhizobium quebecense TaxID=2748629 RepID=A0ACD3VHU3_9BRAD|nr:MULTISPECIES: GMC family oxidoreductase [Bradyrhizobium]UFX46501.1 GMC family oxidoreductase [Bradyrhizobium sp. 41S5]UGY05697.1 GMC family oxidoreductase [Bradyrhizobium quebecense]
MDVQEPFDIVVVGSGAAGGMAAYDLCKAGLRVAVLEAGRDYDPGTETPMFVSQQKAPLRGAVTPDKNNGYYDATVDGGTAVPGEPYTTAADSEEFSWWRPRMLGGRTNHWGRVALRFGPYDFKPKSRDGLGFDWPIEYDDLAPWYDRVERLIGVTGRREGIENTPDPPPGVMLPPPPPRAYEIVLARAFEKLGMRVAAIRAAILTKPLNGRAACLYATACTQGCSSRSNFQSTTVLLPEAQETGNLTIICNAVVREVEIDKSGRATGVSFVDRHTGDQGKVKARCVILAAGAFSSARILLNSKSTSFPNGIGNSQGLVGKYIMDTVEFTVRGRIPILEKLPARNDDGIFTPHIYVPWWLYQEQARGELGFPRGYHIEPRGGRRMPTMGVGGYVDEQDATYGHGLREQILQKYGSYVSLSGEGEMIPNEQTFCELDPDTKDKWGTPVLRFHWKWGDYEVNQWKHQQLIFGQVISSLGGTVTSGPAEMPVGGAAVHEVGGARMGLSDADSVVDQFGQCWEVTNLFVLDGATFVSSPDKNPTLTILAIASRGSARIAELAKRGEL